MSPSTHAKEFITALGSKTNIKDVNACMTRLRITVNDLTKIDKEKLMSLGALDILEVNRHLHVILGAKAPQIRDEINKMLR